MAAVSTVAANSVANAGTPGGAGGNGGSGGIIFGNGGQGGQGGNGGQGQGGAGGNASPGVQFSCTSVAVDLSGYSTNPGTPAVTHTEWYWTQSWELIIPQIDAPTWRVDPGVAGTWSPSDPVRVFGILLGYSTWTYTTSATSVNAPPHVKLGEGGATGSGWEKGDAVTVTDSPAVPADPTPNTVTIHVDGTQAVSTTFGTSYTWSKQLGVADSHSLQVSAVAWNGTPTAVNFDQTKDCTTTIPVPAAPTATAPTCSTPGALYVPADTDQIRWSAVGNSRVKAHAKPGFEFADGKKNEQYDETILPQLSGDDCASNVSASIGLTHHDATCAATAPTIDFTPVDGVVYSTVETAPFGAGTQVHVVASADATHKFVSGDLPAGWTFQDSHHATFTVTFAAAPDCTAVPAAPTVVPAGCDANHKLTAPSATLPTDGDHITYKWYYEPNATGFVAKATLDAGYSWGSLVGTGWQDKGSGNAAYHYVWGAAPDCNVYVTPVVPQLSETCEVNGDGHQTGNVLDDIVLPTDTNDVHYAKHDGKLFAVIQQPVKAYTFFQTLPAGWAFNDGAKHQYLVFTPTYTNPTCLIDTAPAAPTVTQAVCNGPGTHSAATVVDLDGNGVTYTVANDLSTVTATLDSGYQWQKDLPSGWTSGPGGTLVYDVPLTSPGACLVSVAPRAVTAQPGTCDTSTGFDSPATITSPTDGLDEGGITYHVTGLTVTATADSGYQIPPTQGWVNAANLWTYTASVTQPFCPSVIALPGSVPGTPDGTLDGVPGTTNPGQTFTATGTGFAPFATVNFGIYSSPLLLATVSADASGVVKATITIPADFTGDHTVVAAGTGPSGSPLYLAAGTTVVAKSTPTPAGSGSHGVGGVSASRGPGVGPNAGSSSGLANTGARVNPVALTQIGLLALLVGGGLLLATRRRARRH
ncbi:MAG TPA: hypothetical protein VFT67_11120 [Jatrophihabitantaceae bacterium]|nr:hypothetical protein [Jatrophihabitantaceae bacterium]